MLFQIKNKASNISRVKGKLIGGVGEKKFFLTKQKQEIDG